MKKRTLSVTVIVTTRSSASSVARRLKRLYKWVERVEIDVINATKRRT